LRSTVIYQSDRRGPWLKRAVSPPGSLLMQERLLRLAFGFLLALSMGLGRVPAHAAQQYTQSFTFNTSNQSQWAGGPQYMANWSDEYSVSWNNSVAGGSFTDLATPSVTICDPTGVCQALGGGSDCCSTIPGIDFGSFGAEGSASTSGKLGLRPGVTVNGGAVNVSYPVQVTLQYPDAGTLYPGDPFTLLTSFTPTSGGSLTTSSPHARVTVDAILNATFNASARVQAFSKDLFNESLSIPPIGSDSWFSIVDTDSSTFQDVAKAGQFLANYALTSATNGILSGGFKNLSINTNGGRIPGSNSLSSSNEETFFTTKIDYSNAALTVAGLPGFNKTIDVGGLHAALQILDAYERFDLKVKQAFRFDPTPQLSLQLSNGQTINLNAGQSAPLTFPTVTAGAASNNVTITPSYSMSNQLNNETDLVITPSYNFTPLNIGFSGSLDAGAFGTWDLPGFELKPVSNLSWSPGDISINLFNSSFPLQGFRDSTTAPFTLVGYTYPQPSLTSISPPAFKPGATMQLTAAGTNFVSTHTNAVTTLPNTTAQWNGSSRPTQYGSGSQLTFNLSTTDANTEGIFPVAVFNPAPAGGTSNSKNVIIDGTPPVTTYTPTGPQNAGNHGWYKGNATVNLSTRDTYSGVHEVDYQTDGGAFQPVPTGAALGPGTFATPSFIVPGEARHHVGYKSDDNVGNAETQQSQEIDIDGTLPIVTYTGNAGSYTVDQQVNITCTSADPKLADGEPGSGVFSNTCKNIVGPAYSFSLGSNSFSASATDVAGNVGTGSTTFTARVTYDSLCALVQRFITDSGVATALCSQLSQASAAAARGDLTTKSNIMSAFISTVAAQSGKVMTTSQAGILTSLAQAV
jgi:hypothetical protein